MSNYNTPTRTPEKKTKRSSHSAMSYSDLDFRLKMNIAGNPLRQKIYELVSQCLREETEKHRSSAKTGEPTFKPEEVMMKVMDELIQRSSVCYCIYLSLHGRSSKKPSTILEAYKKMRSSAVEGEHPYAITTSSVGSLNKEFNKMIAECAPYLKAITGKIKNRVSVSITRITPAEAINGFGPVVAQFLEERFRDKPDQIVCNGIRDKYFTKDGTKFKVSSEHYLEKAIAGMVNHVMDSRPSMEKEIANFQYLEAIMSELEGGLSNTLVTLCRQFSQMGGKEYTLPPFALKVCMAHPDQDVLVPKTDVQAAIHTIRNGYDGKSYVTERLIHGIMRINGSTTTGTRKRLDGPILEMVRLCLENPSLRGEILELRGSMPAQEFVDRVVNSPENKFAYVPRSALPPDAQNIPGAYGFFTEIKNGKIIRKTASQIVQDLVSQHQITPNSSSETLKTFVATYINSSNGVPLILEEDLIDDLAWLRNVAGMQGCIQKFSLRLNTQMRAKDASKKAINLTPQDTAFEPLAMASYVINVASYGFEENKEKSTTSATPVAVHHSNYGVPSSPTVAHSGYGAATSTPVAVQHANYGNPVATGTPAGLGGTWNQPAGASPVPGAVGGMPTFGAPAAPGFGSTTPGAPSFGAPAAPSFGSTTPGAPSFGAPAFGTAARPAWNP